MALLLLLLGCLQGDEEPVGESSTCPTAPLRCVDPAQLTFQNKTPNGYELCRDGSRNRASAEDVVHVDLDQCERRADEETDVSLCSTDSDCGTNRYCKFGHIEPGGGSMCWCEHGPCTTDADCGDGRACYLTGDCIPAECSANAECESRECGVWSEGGGTDDQPDPNYGLSCRTEADECRDSYEMDTCECGEDFRCLGSEC